MSTEIFLYPDPFIHKVIVEITIKNNDHCIISLFDEAGKIIRIQGVNLSQGVNKIPLNDLHSLPAGPYYLHVNDTDGQNVYKSKLIKY